MSFYTRKTIPAGKAGTQKWQKKYGDALVCVRYKYDKQQKRRQKTIELIVEEGPWDRDITRVPANKIVGIRIDYEEFHLRKSVRSVGGEWNPLTKLWELSYRDAVNLGLEDRIVDAEKSQAM